MAQVLELFETRYFDFTVRHFHEKLRVEHWVRRNYSWTKNTLQAAGKVVRAKRKGVHRRRRPRKPMVGMMLHQIGLHAAISFLCTLSAFAPRRP